MEFQELNYTENLKLDEWKQDVEAVETCPRVGELTLQDFFRRTWIFFTVVEITDTKYFGG